MVHSNTTRMQATLLCTRWTLPLLRPQTLLCQLIHLKSRCLRLQARRTSDKACSIHAMLTLQAKQRKGGDGGRLAESLLSKPVRPAWGKGFCGGGFCRHLWELMESGLLLLKSQKCSSLASPGPHPAIRQLRRFADDLNTSASHPHLHGQVS